MAEGAKQKLTDLLSAFESKAAKLNKSSDSINEIIKAVEERLVRANAGVAVFLEEPVLETGEPHRDGGECTLSDECQLGFTKFDSGWHLAVKKWVIRDFGPEQGSDRAVLAVVPLLQAARNLRIRALEILRDLQEAINERVDRQDEVIAQAKTKLGLE
jgi:hypothetical protein